jgi:hypothetical protein
VQPIFFVAFHRAFESRAYCGEEILACEEAGIAV